jgi:hypothetical protein
MFQKNWLPPSSGHKKKPLKIKLAVTQGREVKTGTKSEWGTAAL